ncbi:DUF5677 domain-containing protein [Streptomyces sp. NBC_00243]|uniref:DUF5677 domain-containing protein n=1 Tax=Streptomyces sp. NBC_00243 TaxID=2975688 RepID=UPI002DD9878C|nr:DUF5677 domain-containing protein [Streptomyces sp. NBC_00243]WRZ17840.1 DUF5677 domain-containing protein [Streptomyces sp. NBC_00243]
MVYKYGDNPQCAKRARVITRLLLDEAAKVTASNPLIPTADQHVAHQMLGWWQFTNRTADLLMRSYDSGFTVEAAGQMRNLIEHAHCMDWLAEHRAEGLRAMEHAEWERRKKLIGNLHAVDWPVPADIEVGEEPAYLFADEDEVRRHRRLKGLIANVADLVASRGIRTMYPVYRYLSSYAHASLQTGEAFVERGPGLAPALYRTGKVPVGESRAWIPVCLYVAGTAMGQFLVNEPMRKTLEKAAYDLGIGEIVAERIRLELNSR